MPAPKIIPKIKWEGTKVSAIGRALENPLPILRAWAALWIAATQKGHREQKRGPFAWKARMTPNLPGMLADFARGPNVPKRRFQDRPALVDTGAMRSSYAWFSRSQNSIFVGTMQPYANLHQLGGKVKVKITPAIRHNLWIWMKGQAGKMSKGGLLPGSTPAEKKAARQLAKSRVKPARRVMSDRYGWIFGTDEVEFNIRARPHVVFTHDDRANMDRLIIQAMKDAQ